MHDYPCREFPADRPSAELAELDAALADAADGRPSLAFVAGESGVGKTRLLTEFMRRAREHGVLVLAGETVDFGGESELPYLPLVAALRPLVRSGDPALTESVREAVAPLLPGIEAYASGSRSDAVQGSQGRLFEGLLVLLDALGQERPVLLVIEDLHWADPSTRSAVAFLARSLTNERVLVVGSYRTDELPRREHPFRLLLAELESAPRARRIPLRPLTRDELAEQLDDILGAPPAVELLERLWTRSGGNPLFGEELLAAGLDGRGAPPDNLRDALMMRVERLSEPSRVLLGLVAVGHRLEEELLEQTSGLEPRALRDALREAVGGHVLVAQDDGTYRFRHALLREVVEDELLPGERRELHLDLAHALEQRLTDGAYAQVSAAIAHHFDAGGDRPGPGSLAGVDRVTLLARAAEAAGALGDPGRELALLESALADLGARPEARRAAPILEAIARAQRHLNRSDDGIATLERALDLVERGGDDGDPSLRAGVLAGLGRALMIAGRVGDAARVARQALRVAGAAGLPLVEGSARNTLGYSIAIAGDVDEGAAELREAIRIAREHSDLPDLVLAYNNYADVLHIAGRSAEARAVAVEGRRAVEGLRPIGRTWLDSRLAEIAFDIGEWELSESVLPEPRPWTGTQTRLGLGLRRAMLAAGRGDHAAADDLLAELGPMAADSTEPQLLGPLSVLTVELRSRAGDLDAARAAVEEGLERIDACSDDAIHGAALSRRRRGRRGRRRRARPRPR